MKQTPDILATKIVAKTQVFCIESQHLRFSNGVERTYERLVAGGRGAVMIVPVNATGELLLIREYAAGTERYELAFPKGLVENGETFEQAADRELKEEVGFGAHKMTRLKAMTLAPGYLTHTMGLVLAEDLYPARLPGDEPEVIDVVPWPLARAQDLLAQEDFTEARSIAALFLARDILCQTSPT